MPAKNPRISITVNEELAEILESIAIQKRESISQVVRRLLELGLLLSEDAGLVKLAEERLKDFSEEEALSHEEVWD